MSLFIPLPARQNSSLKVKDVAKIMNIRAAKTDSVFSGHYTLSDDKVTVYLSPLWPIFTSSECAHLTLNFLHRLVMSVGCF